MILKVLTAIPLFKRFLPSLIKRLKIKRIKYVYENIIFYLDLRYLVDRRFFLNGYDEENIKILKNFVKKNQIEYFLDIGSCWGIYSLQLAKFDPNLKVIAFDAFENNIKRLKEMMAMNKIINLDPYNYALGDLEKFIEFSVNEEFSPNYSKDLNGKFKIKTKQKTLDSFLNIKDTKLIIKIDVERSEADVLNGANKLLKNNLCFVQIESDNHKSAEIKNIFKILAYKQQFIKTANNDLYFSNFPN